MGNDAYRKGTYKIVLVTELIVENGEESTKAIRVRILHGTYLILSELAIFYDGGAIY